jgi:plastocyanin
MRIWFVLLTLSLTLACNDKELLEPQPPPGEVDVNATTNLTFNPNPVTVATGGTVRYVFAGTAHTVIFERKEGAPDDIIQESFNTIVEREFPIAGQFPYRCGIHDGMNGTIFVQAP